MATAWAQTATEMIRSSLEIMGIITATETPSAEDHAACLKALNGLLKEMPVYGYLWPEYVEGVALTWSNLTPSTVTLPTNFYGFPLIRRGDGVPLSEFSPAQWADVDTTTRAQTAEKPTHFYVNGSTVTLWPIPTVSPSLTANYQAKADDAAGAAVPDVPQSWYNALPWGIADECGLRFQVPPDVRAEINGKWESKMAYLLSSAAPNGPIEFSVAD